jgi:uncharacterized membrane protein YvlD (DUF360 family)
MGRTIRWLIGAVITQTFLILVLDWIFEGFSTGSFWSAVVSAILISAILALSWPLIYRISARFHPVLFPILSFILTGLVIYLAAKIGPDNFHVASIATGILVAIGLSVGNVILTILFSLDDTQGYEWYVVRPLKRSYASTPTTSTPGVLFLEIDGLAEPIFRRAIAEGYMPTLERWLTNGSHTLLGWEPDLSAQTSASQAGILLGDNTGIPAFRWYDKQAGKLMVSSKMDTAKELEKRLSTGDGLLSDGGASRWNVFTGDSFDCLCTFSAVGDKTRTKSRGYAAYFSNPYTLTRTLTLFFSDVVRELWQARRQVQRNEQPRIHRHFKYAFIRAATTTFMQEASLFMLISDMFKGVPAVYNTFFAYDEVAHHSGTDRPDALKVLRTLDSVFEKLERAADKAPRPYHFVILSDHGQSMGATFLQRYDQSLSDLVSTLISPDNNVASEFQNMEDWGHVNLALSEAIRQDNRTSRLLQKVTKSKTSEGTVALGPETEAVAGSDGALDEKTDVVVLASGNLGLISFPGWKKRMTYEEIKEAFPELLGGLSQHPGVGFVMVNSETDGGIVIGGGGIHYLEDEHVVGVDPLANYGTNAVRHLTRANGFEDAPDIYVISMYKPETGEVAAFEELVGCHGGLGGTQTHPFVFYPSEFPAPAEPIIGAGALHTVLKEWRRPSENLTGTPQPEQVAISV